MTPLIKIISVFISKEDNLLGNTSAVVMTLTPLSAKEMQQLASDLNQPATTFLWNEDGKLKVRWFAPDAEIDLCGHGTLAALTYFNNDNEVTMHYNDGVISGFRNSDGYTMTINPIHSSPAGEPDKAILDGLNVSIEGYFSNPNKNIVLLKDEETVRNLKPDFAVLKHMEPFGIVVTAPGNNTDFVSRTFVPKVQQLEDHATGSSHAALTPFWTKKLKKNKLTAHQLSPRGGKFICELQEDKVLLTGQARIVAEGILPD